MKKLCAIILPTVLSVVLSSCTWVYQVTGMEAIAWAEETAGRHLPETTAKVSDTGTAISTEPAPLLQEGHYSNGQYVMELTSIGDYPEDGYYIIIYTPQYGFRMFSGITRESSDWNGTFTVVDHDDSRMSLVVVPSEDGHVLQTQLFVGEEEKAAISGDYTYYDQEYWETEVVLANAGIAAGVYTYAGYRMGIEYTENYIRVEICSTYGESLLQVTKKTDEILHSAIFEGDQGTVMLVSVGDGSGNVVVSGQDDAHRPLQYAGTYTLSK